MLSLEFGTSCESQDFCETNKTSEGWLLVSQIIQNSEKPVFVVGVTGASGSAYAVRLMQVLLSADCRLHVVFSSASREVMQRELDCQPPNESGNSAVWGEFLQQALNSQHSRNWGFASVPSFTPQQAENLTVHDIRNFSAGIASGSSLTSGMVVCPCSMGTLSALANGTSTNLIHRAADVHLKERRRMIVVPREMPVGLIGLRNMTTLTEAGATVMPAMPGFYHRPDSIADLVDFVVARICDHLGVPHCLMSRWGNEDITQNMEP